MPRRRRTKKGGSSEEYKRLMKLLRKQVSTQKTRRVHAEDINTGSIENKIEFLGDQINSDKKRLQHHIQRLQKAQMELVEHLAAKEVMRTMSKLVKLSEIHNIIQNRAYTLLAPTDDMMSTIDLEGEELYDKEKLKKFIAEHVILGHIDEKKIKSESPSTVMNLNGNKIKFQRHKENGKILVVEHNNLGKSDQVLEVVGGKQPVNGHKNKGHVMPVTNHGKTKESKIMRNLTNDVSDIQDRLTSVGSTVRDGAKDTLDTITNKGKELTQDMGNELNQVTATAKNAGKKAQGFLANLTSRILGGKKQENQTGGKRRRRTRKKGGKSKRKRRRRKSKKRSCY